mgnify:FL=1
MGDFKRGAYMLASDLQLPVVPLTINGSFQVMPRMRDMKWVQWHPLTLTIHEPIPPKEQSPENITATLQESYQVIMNALPAELQGYQPNSDQ